MEVSVWNDVAPILPRKRRTDRLGNRADSGWGLIWGCDICNDVCPMNQEAKVLTPVPEFLESAVAVLDAQIAERLLKTRAYNYRGKKTILRNIQLLEGANEDDR